MQKIQDFGKKIGGAKKDLWKERNLIFEDTLDMTEVEKRKYVKRDNIWKKIDVDSYLEKGYPRLLVFWIKEIRACVYPDMKHTIRGISDYIKAVERLRDIINEVKNLGDIDTAWEKILSEDGILHQVGNYQYDYVDSCRGAINGQKLLNLHGPYAMAQLEKKMEKTGFGLSKREFLSSKFNIVRFDEKEIKKEYSHYGIEKENLYLLQRTGNGKKYYYPVNKNVDLEKLKEGDYLLLSNNDILTFGSESEVIIFKCELIDKLLESKKKTRSKRKKKWTPKQLAQLERKGKDYRHGRDVSGEDFLKAFHIRGGEFGNYTNDKDRQSNLNMAFDAFCDLADALQISREDIGLTGLSQGSLAIAFGARGSGNALAHYEMGSEVINLTKMRGAGSLAHEWGHAFDDFVGKVTENYLGKFASEMLSHDTIPKTFKNLILELVRDKDGKLTNYCVNANKLDKIVAKTSHGYWRSTTEMLARAFACYVKDKLKESGNRDDYLCGHAEAVILKNEDETIYGYPVGEERQRFNDLFDQLFLELKQLHYFHEPIKEYEFKEESVSSDFQFSQIDLTNAEQMTFADFGL